MKRMLLFLCLLGFHFGFSQQITQVEYWFNANFAGRTLQNITTNANNETDVSIAFPDNGTNEFYETLYFRFKDSAGNWSPIQSSQMLNANDTQIYLVQMEYWFDNNFAQKTTIPITATINPNGSLQMQEADVAWQTNAQTIYYRFKSKYNQWTAIQSSNIDQMPNVNNKIVSAEYWLNNDFANRQTTTVAQNNSFYLDMQNLNINSNNQETIHLRYKDKMNRWSSIYSFYSDYQGDEIEPTPTGTINLVTLKLAGGKVNVAWNSVDNGKLYMIYRDGLYWRSLENTHHPQNLEAVDFPPLGNHSYYVVAKNYLNPNGVTSNTDNETIDQADIDTQNDPTNPNQYGTLSGTITDANGNRIDDVQITYSHDGYTVYSNLGQFKREGIAFGTQGTISLSKAGYTFAPATNATYTITEPLQTLSFIGTSSNPSADNQVYSLEQTSGFTILTASPQFKSPFETTVTIKNLGTTAWSGKIQLVANKSATLNWNPYSIIDEIQVSNLGAGQERILELATNSLELQPDNYNLKILAYRLEENLNSTIQNIKIGNGVVLSNNFVVGSNNMYQTLSQVMQDVETAINNSPVLANILIQSGITSPEIKDAMLSLSMDQLQTAADYVSEGNSIIAGINNLNQLYNINNQTSYWSALKMLSSLCGGTTYFCKLADFYLEISSSAIDAIQALENMTYASQATVNLFQGGIFKLKIYQHNYVVDAFDSYYAKDLFANQIASIHFVEINPQGTILNDYQMSKIECPTGADNETLCLALPDLSQMNELSMGKFLVKVIWTNGKITYVPFSSDYFEDIGNDYLFKLDASKAGSNVGYIKRFAQPIFN